MNDRSVTSPPPLLTPDDAAETCQVSRKTVYRWIRGRKLKAYRLGAQWRIKPKDLRSFIEANAR